MASRGRSTGKRAATHGGPDMVTAELAKARTELSIVSPCGRGSARAQCARRVDERSSSAALHRRASQVAQAVLTGTRSRRVIVVQEWVKKEWDAHSASVRRREGAWAIKPRRKRGRRRGQPCPRSAQATRCRQSVGRQLRAMGLVSRTTDDTPEDELAEAELEADPELPEAWLAPAVVRMAARTSALRLRAPTTHERRSRSPGLATTPSRPGGSR